MTDAPMETLEAWPWPRWEFVTATPDDDGITIALAPMADGRTVDSTGHEITFDG